MQFVATMNPNSLDRKTVSEEQWKLAHFLDGQLEINKIDDEDCSLAGGDENSSWNSVYKSTTVCVKYDRKAGFSRYLPSLRHILPIRDNSGSGSYMPVDSTGCCSFTFFSWLTPLIWKTFRRGLTYNDLYYTSPDDSCEKNGARLGCIWRQETKKLGLQYASLSQPIYQFLRTRFLMSCLMYILCVTFGFLGPTLFMGLLIDYIQKPEIDHLEGVTWLLCLVISEFLRICCFALMWAINLRTAIRTSSAVKSLVYNKLMKMPSVVHTSVGELINLFANDCQKIFMMIYNAPLIIGGPLVITGAIVYTGLLLRYYCFVGVGVFIVSYALQGGISYGITRVRTAGIKATDHRVSLMSEFLNNIKLIKLCAWEKPLVDKIREARSIERNYLEKSQYLQTISSSIASMSAIVATIFTILVYSLCGGSLTPAEAFTLVIVNSVASHGIRTLPMCIRDIVNGMVALSRLQAILHVKDKDNYVVSPGNSDHAVNIANATLVWEQVQTNMHHSGKKTNKKGEVNLMIMDNEKILHQEEVTPATALVTLQSETGLPPALIDIDFILPKGQLVGVCGNVGSGKSALISAILGQMHLVKGKVAVQGSVAYVPQQSWIMNTTLRENILFGQLFSSKRYYEAVYCCGLTEDFTALPGGDQTQVSEKGVNLSGGQRQRTSLARAQYADKDLYLLDDPLSSVDAYVGRHIFQNCIKGALKGKTILLVTNQVKYLEQCNTIILMRDGQIIERGTHQELVGKESEYSFFVEMFSKDDQLIECAEIESPVELVERSLNDDRRSRSKSPSIPESMADFDEGNVVTADLGTSEKVARGDISWETYLAYIQAAGGFIICYLVLIWFVLQAGSAAFSKYWLSYWLSQGSGNMTNSTSSIMENENLGMYQLVYGLSVVVMLVVSISLGFFFTKVCFPLFLLKM